MNTQQHIRCLISEVGPVFDEIEWIDQISEDDFGIVFGNGTAIEVEVNEADDKLQFKMLLGPVAPDQHDEMYTLLLTFNFLKDETGGFLTALDGPEGNVYLMLDVCDLNLDLSKLAGILAEMLNTGQTLRDVLVAEQPIKGESTQPDISGQIQV